jgi:predicted nucleotidyltransferase
MNTAETHIKKFGLDAVLIAQIVETIVRLASPKRIILYGSRARGDYSATSDIDIAVECDKGKDFIRNEIDDGVRTLLKMEIVDVDEIGSQLRSEIEREGAILYEKT